MGRSFWPACCSCWERSFYVATRPFFQAVARTQAVATPPLLARPDASLPLARFYRSLGMLLPRGMPVVTALQMVSELLQLSLRGKLTLATAVISEGQSISSSHGA